MLSRERHPWNTVPHVPGAAAATRLPWSFLSLRQPIHRALPPQEGVHGTGIHQRAPSTVQQTQPPEWVANRGASGPGGVTACSQPHCPFFPRVAIASASNTRGKPNQSVFPVLDSATSCREIGTLQAGQSRAPLLRRILLPAMPRGPDGGEHHGAAHRPARQMPGRGRTAAFLSPNELSA